MWKYYSKFHLVCDVLCILSFIGLAIFLATQWQNLPEQIPQHYNIAGEPDAWAEKGMLLFMPGMSLFLYLLVSVLGCFPKTWNIPVAVTEENRDRLLLLTRNLLAFTKTMCVAIFFYITCCTVTAQALSVWFLPVSMGLLFGGIIWYAVLAKKLSATGGENG